MYLINFNDKNSEGTHRVTSFIDKNLAVHFDFFEIEYIPLEILNTIRDKSITHNIFRIQDNDSIMCGFYCIAFKEYMFVGKTLSDYTNLFSANDYNGKIILLIISIKYFKETKTK